MIDFPGCYGLNCAPSHTNLYVEVRIPNVAVLRDGATQQAKVPDQMTSQMSFTKHMKNQHLSSNYSKKFKRMEDSQTHFMRPAVFYFQNQIKTLQRKKIVDRYPQGTQMLKSSTKGQQTGSSITLKRSCTMIKWDLFWDARLAQYLLINKWDILHKQSERQKSHDHIKRYRKNI